MSTIYVFTDIEADGPVPGLFSMLSLASVAYSIEGKELTTFEKNLIPLPDASQHPDTMAWWKTEPEAWNDANQNQSPPDLVMKGFKTWWKELPGEPIFVSHPIGLDFAFVNWYVWKYLNERLIGWSGIDLQTYAMIKLDWGFLECDSKNYPEEWLGLKHSHRAIDDARGYANLFFELRTMGSVHARQKLNPVS